MLNLCNFGFIFKLEFYIKANLWLGKKFTTEMRPKLFIDDSVLYHFIYICLVSQLLSSNSQRVGSTILKFRHFFLNNEARISGKLTVNGDDLHFPRTERPRSKKCFCDKIWWKRFCPLGRIEAPPRWVPALLANIRLGWKWHCWNELHPGSI